MFRWLTITLLAATVSAPFSTAQMRGGRSVSMSHGGGFHHGTRRFNGGGFLGSPFFSDYDAAESGAVENAPPLVLIQRAAAAESETKPRLAPLLIEWQGNRYVRFGGAQGTEERGTSQHPDYAESNPPMPARQKVPQNEDAASPRELPSAVLVYRDGHREEVSDYAIANGMIYIQGDYWQSGHSTKPVALSALDTLATIQANQERGVKFMLPSASNVVIASF
jgi:hypothetical protein